MTDTSLLVGSDTLGWQELGGKAVLGNMTKAIPGGDGSLDFSLYGDDAWAARNVLVPGSAEVKLLVGGEPVYGGVIISDPVRHRLSCQSVVEVACSGPYGLAARDGRYGYIGVDTDLEQWRQYRGIGEHSGRFVVSTEGQLEIRADSDKNYANGDAAGIAYTIYDGLLNELLPSVDFEYKCNLPDADWYATIVAGNSPVHAIASGLDRWTLQGPLTVSTWTADTAPETIDTPYACSVLRLYTTAANKPATDPFIRLRKVRVLGRETAPLTPDYDLMLADIVSDLAAALSVTNTRIHTDLSTFEVEQFVARFPTDIAETLRQACALYTSPIEAFFDLDPVALTRRFTARPRPLDTALAPENRLWVVGGRGGEDTSGLVRDWEATPEQVTVLYAVKDHATLPDGTVQATTYPGGTESTYPAATVADLTQDKGAMSATVAANYAQAIYNYGQSNRYTGEVTVLESVHDEHGVEHPAWRVRPGDRVTALDRDDTDRFGETLYVQGTDYDWRTGRGTVTIGSPFDPLETGYRGGRTGRLFHGGPGRPGRYHVRTGIA